MLRFEGPSLKRAKETVGMGWSEKYWEDVKYELEQLTTEPELTGEDETLGQPAIEKPTETPEKD
jgi:hypothetical protein